MPTAPQLRTAAIKTRSNSGLMREACCTLVLFNLAANGGNTDEENTEVANCMICRWPPETASMYGCRKGEGRI